MAGEIEKPCKEGYLWFPPHGVIGQLKKMWQKKYCQLFRASKQGIERLEMYESAEDSSKTLSLPIITLENCIKITQDPQKNQPHVFIVVTKSSIHHFAGNSEEDMLSWMSAFQSVAFRDTASRQTIEEDNDLYCSSADGVFAVRLVSSEASGRCGLVEGDYTLVVGPAELQLRDPRDQGQILLTWPYRFIRRYGYRSGRFTFEAGRKCISGEGTFILQHSNQQQIFRCISGKMRQMKSVLSGSDSLVCGESQLQHALGMAARSRSPLPPSPTPCRSVPPPPPRRPAKPPRKHPPPPHYDDVEVRAEAWKTLGAMDDRTQTGGGGMFTRSVGHYDKLHHFVSPPAPGYRHITPPNLPSTQERRMGEIVTSVGEEKEDTGNGMESARLADDSHQGYGVIRKKSGPSPPPHALYNDLEYAVVLRAHRV